MTRNELPKYPKYKDSEVEWIGEIPMYWHKHKLRFAVSFRGGGTPSKDNMDYWKGNIPWVSPKDMKSFVISEAEDHVTAAAIHASATSLIDPGNVLIVVRSGILRRCIPVAINSVSIALNQDMKAMETKKNLLPKFLMFLIHSNENALLVLWRKHGATVESIEQSNLANTWIAIPPIEEQRSIVAFLDIETGKIDRLMDVRRKQIDILREQRAAVIHHAVTRGIDTTVPMKDSGIEWLGEIPAHWEVKPLWSVATIRNSNVDKKSVDGEQYVFLCNYVDVYKNEWIDGNIEFMEATATITEMNAFRLREGDVIITKDSEDWRDIAVPALVTENIHNLLCGYHLALLRAKAVIQSAYMFRLFQSKSFSSFFATKALGVTRFGLAQYAVRRCMTTVPTIEEQTTIVAHIDRETAKIDALIDKYEREIVLLEEYRASLISHAVTGKIDVRGLVETTVEKEDATA